MNNDFMNRVNAIMLEQQQPPAQDQYGAFAEMVPRQAQLMNQPHMLAYINPQEEQMLRDMGGAGLPGPDGIPVYGHNWFHSGVESFGNAVSNIGSSFRETASNVYDTVSTGLTNTFTGTGADDVGKFGLLGDALGSIGDDLGITDYGTNLGAGSVEEVTSTVLPEFKDSKGGIHETQEAADLMNTNISDEANRAFAIANGVKYRTGSGPFATFNYKFDDNAGVEYDTPEEALAANQLLAAQVPVETTNSVVAQDFGQVYDASGNRIDAGALPSADTSSNTIIQDVKNFFTPFDGTSYEDGVLQTDNSEYGQYTSVDGETTSNIRPLARAHTVDLEGNLIQPTITTNDDGTTTFDNTAEDGNVYYDDSVTRGQLNPSLYTPGAGGEDFDATMLEQFGDATLSTMAAMFLPGGAFIGTLKNIGNWLIEPSLDDKVVSKVDGKVIYENSEGQYYSDDSSGDSYLVTGSADPTPLVTADTSTSNDDTTAVQAAPVDNLVTTNLTETQAIEEAYQRRRKGGGYGMLPDYMKKYVSGQVFDEKVRKVVLDDGTEVFVTPDNRILSEEDLANTAVSGDIEYIKTGETEEVAAGYTVMDNNTGILTRYDNDNNIVSEVDTAVMGALRDVYGETGPTQDDADFILRMAGGLEPEDLRYDFNNSGTITAQDSLEIAKFLGTQPSITAPQQIVEQSQERKDFIA